jgi:purine-nucleoside phosphorylase
MQNQEKVQNCADTLKSLLPQGFIPKVGIVLGTGLGGTADLLEGPVTVPYEKIPGFPRSTVVSHAGRFTSGLLAGVPVIAQQGRCHLYEGRTPEEVVMGVRVMALLGMKSLILTNSAGSLNPLFPAGGLMLIEDQINFSGHSPLTGPNVDAWGPRFPDVSALYDPTLGACFERAALARGVRLEKGVYLCIPGPQFETRAETRAYRMLGADAVGMSTALEALAAHHMGVRVTGISCLSNQNLPDCMGAVSIEEVVAASEAAAEALSGLLVAALPEALAAAS